MFASFVCKLWKQPPDSDWDSRYCHGRRFSCSCTQSGHPEHGLPDAGAFARVVSKGVCAVLAFGGFWFLLLLRVLESSRRVISEA